MPAAFSRRFSFYSQRSDFRPATGHHNSWLAETTGVVISFYLMRFFFRDTAQKLIEKSNSLKSIDEASSKHGLEWMAFARALPYFPSGILTAVGAVSSMSARDYIIANLIGKFPSTALEVVIGHDVVNFQEHSQRLTILILVVGAVFFAYKNGSIKREINLLRRRCSNFCGGVFSRYGEDK